MMGQYYEIGRIQTPRSLELSGLSQAVEPLAATHPSF